MQVEVDYMSWQNLLRTCTRTSSFQMSSGWWGLFFLRSSYGEYFGFSQAYFLGWSHQTTHGYTGIMGGFTIWDD